MSRSEENNRQPIQTIRKVVLLFCLATLFMNNAFGQQSLRSDLKKELQQLKPNLKSTLQDSSYVNVMTDLAFAMRFYKGDSLLSLSKEALEKSESIGFNKGKIVARLGIGDYYSDQGDHNKGVLYFTEALTAAQELKNYDLILYAENRLAGEYEYQGDYAMALQELLKGIEIAKSINDIERLSIFNENIALLYHNQKDYEEALNYLNLSKKLNEEIDDRLYAARTWANMASVYADAHQYDYAMFNVNQSIAIFEKQQIMEWLAFAYETKGKTYLRQGKYKWASYWYNQSEMLHNKTIDDERGKIDLVQGLAETYLAQQKDSLSAIYATNAYELSKKLKVKEGVKNAVNTLYQIHKKKNNYAKALEYHEMYQRFSDTLYRNESKKSLLMLKTRVNHEKQKEEIIFASEAALTKQKNYLTGILGLVLVLALSTFLVKRNERIQKSLNKELTSKKVQLEKNEEELLEINETKDRLFSIIGHDLRGPIGAFQGVLQLFKKGELDEKEFLSFIPKLKSDIDHIAFTLNNLLSWGQSQMKGATTKPMAVCLEQIVSENINLLSEIAGGKSIQLINEIEQDALVWSDRNQIDIVIRNLISNALKFTQKKGSVTISAFEKNEHFEISVQDTGVGIDQETQDKIFAKNSNITTYGTANEKGTGLGLNLCKEMVEKNKGTIWVNSVLNQGTCFKFTLPKTKKIYEQAS